MLPRKRRSMDDFEYTVSAPEDSDSKVADDVDVDPRRAGSQFCREKCVGDATCGALAMIVDHCSKEASESSSAQKRESEKQAREPGAEYGTCIIFACLVLVFLKQDQDVWQQIKKILLLRMRMVCA